MTEFPDFDEVEQPADVDEAPLDVPEAFSVRDDDSANWVVRKIAEARSYAAHVKEWAKREQERAERDEERLMARFSAELEEWARAQLTGKKKSVDLPAGRLGFRSEPAKLTYVDKDAEKAALEWARKCHAECVVVIPASERLDKEAINRLMKTTGEIPDGATLVEATELFYVK